MIEIPNGLAVIQQIRAKTPECLLSFSRGKDAIAAWLRIKDVFDNVVPYFYYLVPNLEFVEEDLSRWEVIFGKKIIRLPNPALYRMLANNVFQPPIIERIDYITDCQLPRFDMDDVRDCAARLVGISNENKWVAVGVRAKDSPARMWQAKKCGGIKLDRQQFHPVVDMSKADLVDMFKHHNVKLPVDYQLFGSTFDGLYARYTVPIKKHFPKDYQKICEYFPLVEAEVFRAERVWK